MIDLCQDKRANKAHVWHQAVLYKTTFKKCFWMLKFLDVEVILKDFWLELSCCVVRVCPSLCSSVDQSIQDENMKKLESPKTCYRTIWFPKLFPAMSCESERHHGSDKGSVVSETYGGEGTSPFRVISSTACKTLILLYGYTYLSSLIIVTLIKAICLVMF